MSVGSVGLPIGVGEERLASSCTTACSSSTGIALRISLSRMLPFAAHTPETFQLGGGNNPPAPTDDGLDRGVPIGFGPDLPAVGGTLHAPPDVNVEGGHLAGGPGLELVHELVEGVVHTTDFPDSRSVHTSTNASTSGRTCGCSVAGIPPPGALLGRLLLLLAGAMVGAVVTVAGEGVHLSPRRQRSGIGGRSSI